MKNKYFTNDSSDDVRSLDEQTNVDFPLWDDDAVDSSSKNYRRQSLPWEEDSTEVSELPFESEYEIVRKQNSVVPSINLFDESEPQKSPFSKRRKSNKKPFQISPLGYLIALCLVTTLGVFAFLSFSKFKLNAVGDQETVARLHVGSCVRCDNLVVGVVKELDLQTGTAKLELERDSLIPRDSQFVFSSKKYGEHIEILRGSDSRTLQSNSTVSLASELDLAALDPAFVREKIEQGVDSVKKTSIYVGEATGLDPQFVLCCIVLLMCLVAAFVFHRIRGMFSLAFFGAFLSLLCLVVRWLPEIQRIISTLIEAFQ